MDMDLKKHHPGTGRSKIPNNNRNAKAKSRKALSFAFLSVLVISIIFILSSNANSAKSSKEPLKLNTENIGLLASGDSLLQASLSFGSPVFELPESVASLAAIRRENDRVRSGDTFERVLKRHDIGYQTMIKLIESAHDDYNLNRVVIGRELDFCYQDTNLLEMCYEINEDETLCLKKQQDGSWNSQIKETEYEIVEKGVYGVIESSLYQTLVSTCGLPELALKLSEVFAWQIDFHSEIRKGDNFKVIYEEKRHPKGGRKVGRIIATEFQNDKRHFSAFEYYTSEDQFDYFDTDGNSLRKAFLRSPFKYMPRISSGFSRSRFHPILKRYRPHLGIDYAAPTGTPILALGDGKIVKRGRNGGYGNYIRIKHNSMYETGYGHMSRYARGIKVGSQVHQGDVIGYVGSTGLATGPHLDFRFYKNSQPINPLTVDIPAGDPVPENLMADYKSRMAELENNLAAISASGNETIFAVKSSGDSDGSKKGI